MDALASSNLWPGRGIGINYITEPPANLKPPYKRKFVFLGSTGSIGKNALAVAREADLNIVGLAAGKNAKLLAEQAGEFKPKMLAVADQATARQLKGLLPSGYKPQILIGQAGYAAMASNSETDLVLSAQAGSAGLEATLAATLAGKTIALANKESLVMAGGLIRKICSVSGAAILPVDSEHFAIFQCACGKGANADKIILTASGGPFRKLDQQQLAHVTPKDALAHPNWSMGNKISIDSATLMNKGLEYLEAGELFGPTPVSILIHPQSIIHSMIQFADNSILAQLAVPDMRLPIGACLLWPKNWQAFVEPLNLAQVGMLSFENPDAEKFPCLDLAIKCKEYPIPAEWWNEMRLNPATIVLNAANEVAVDLFLKNECSFAQIAELIKKALDTLVFSSPPAIITTPAAQSLAAICDAALANIKALSQTAINFVLQEKRK